MSFVKSTNKELPNFTLSNKGTLTDLLHSKRIFTFQQAIFFMQSLPNKELFDVSDLRLVVTEYGGTADAKHAYLAQVAEEQEHNEVQLMLGMYKMHSDNTENIESVLEDVQLPYLPQASCYLMYKNTRIAVPFPTLEISFNEIDLIEEKPIMPSQIGKYKQQYHKLFIGKWRMLNRKASRHAASELWAITQQATYQLASEQI